MLLFSTDAAFIQEAVAARVDGIVVDWERLGKEARQASADTQIGSDTFDDLVRVRASTDALIICRINGYGDLTAEEAEKAIEGGANEILLPMVRTLEEVESVLKQVEGRCELGILVETLEATKLAEQLGGLPLSRIYVGLNDLAIERKTPNIFTAVIDGTVERIRRAIPLPFGFAGLTVPEGGHPIPCRLLMGEMARLRCDFSFLRRSFHRDIRGRHLAVEIPRIRAAIREAVARDDDAVANDRRALVSAVRAWNPGTERVP